MREGWEYRKLGEVCDKITDGSHNPPKGCKISDYIMISSQNVYNNHIDLTNVRYLSKENWETENKRTNIKKGDLLLTIVGTIGRCAIVKGTEGKITLQRSVAVLSPKESIDSSYMMYCLLMLNEELDREAHGIAQKGIYLRQLSQFIIPVPPLPEQERIVAELDLLSGIIEKQKAVLKDLDTLSQSIFYEMFGDPVSNDKGWEQKKLGEVCKIQNGKDHKAVNRPDGVYPIYGSGGIMGYANSYLCEAGATIIGRKGSINNPIFVDTKFWNVDTAFSLCPNEDYVPRFLFYTCKSIDFTNYNKSTTLPSLVKSDLLKIEIPIPPLPLQQSFAQKIEAVEKQKELMRKSLAETETLFKGRMSYYFD